MMLNYEQEKAAKEMLRQLVLIQTEYWNAAGELELILGCHIDTTIDLQEYTIGALQAAANKTTPTPSIRKAALARPTSSQPMLVESRRGQPRSI